ncbi:hypothetical protein BU14_2267s0001 [Porphyra umbilicalis]|uniref:Uncharacterized protein n=1 Tax=Porphyra umbilicalis TaxID=2786 RepID=A0A1X6NJI3_PORUM|nr:hypothetical protein BU14_2267s0001 [Porphyra umbilicalis]|eukprot:OSX68771.1 hypothetical protein BU14_2267s0001 [Porphyra umbilicalis]
MVTAVAAQWFPPTWTASFTFRRLRTRGTSRRAGAPAGRPPPHARRRPPRLGAGVPPVPPPPSPVPAPLRRSASTRASCRRSTGGATASPPPSSGGSSPRCSPAATWSPWRAPGRAKRRPSSRRCCTSSRPTGAWAAPAPAGRRSLACPPAPPGRPPSCCRRHGSWRCKRFALPSTMPSSCRPRAWPRRWSSVESPSARSLRRCPPPPRCSSPRPGGCCSWPPR